MRKLLRLLIPKYKTRRKLVAIFCTVVCLCIAFVMFFIYNPNQNNLRALSSVCMDIVCIIILIILVGSFASDNYGLYRTTRLYAGLLVATIWAIFLDFLNWAFDGALAFFNLTFWFTVGSLCMGAILAGMFSVYLYEYMKEIHGLNKMRQSAIVCGLMNLVSFVLTFALAITGTAFKFVDGHYEIGALYDVVTVIPILSILYMTGYIIRHFRKVGLHDVFAVTGYIFFMVCGAIIESVYVIGTTYVAVAIADIFIFVMLQNEIIAREKRNVQKWMMKSNTDELTGFYNRHAYESDLIQFGKDIERDKLVYVSMDVNSLKETNDTFGHNAGDELLIGASMCIKECFSEYGKLYRIGGDEFVAIIHADDMLLNELKANMDIITRKWSGNLVEKLAISCGYVSFAEDEATNMTLDQIAILADRRMYEAKAMYYKVNGIERRNK